MRDIGGENGLLDLKALSHPVYPGESGNSKGAFENSNIAIYLLQPRSASWIIKLFWLEFINSLSLQEVSLPCYSEMVTLYK